MRQLPSEYHFALALTGHQPRTGSVVVGAKYRVCGFDRHYTAPVYVTTTSANRCMTFICRIFGLARRLHEDRTWPHRLVNQTQAPGRACPSSAPKATASQSIGGTVHLRAETSRGADPET